MTRILLVGGGHAHVHLLKVAAGLGPSGLELTLVSPFPSHHYSGMVPGYLAGVYDERELAFDLRALAGAAGARFVPGWVREISMARAVARVETGIGEATLIGFDRVSLDAGSVPAAMEVPGVSDHAVAVRPMNRAVELAGRLDGAIRAGGTVRVVVVGAGAAGFEVALAVHRRIENGGALPQVTLVDGASRILGDFGPRVRRRAEGILSGRVELRTGVDVTEVLPDGVRFADGGEIGAEVVAWLTGAAPPPLIGASDLPLDARGFFLVDSTLRAVDGAPAWGAGDCIALDGHPDMPRAGVFAVRQAPVLAANVLNERGPGTRSYAPQRSFLSLMSTADGRALLRWKAIVSHSRWAWWLKDRIDRAFMARYGSRA
jgi:NADH dehydrogenase FAD-containing subunit